MRSHYYAKSDRFDNYREIEARYTAVGSCGHDIRKGDRIGWNPRAHRTQCVACWARWVTENAEAAAIEAGNVPNCL
jgi:hypothetical protein